MRNANINLVAHGTKENIERFYNAFENRFEESEIGYDGLSAAFESNGDDFIVNDRFTNELIDYSAKLGLRIMYKAYEEFYTDEETEIGYEMESFWNEPDKPIKFDHQEHIIEINDEDDEIEAYERISDWMMDIPSHDELPEIV